MAKKLALILSMLPIFLFGKTSIYNIQYTTLAGDGNLFFELETINGSEVQYTSGGTITSVVEVCTTPQADTVTVVQRPLINIPSMVKPGEVLNIECFAPAITTDWDAELIFNDITVDLTISQAGYDATLERWTLQAVVPEVDYYELYDLKVTASDNIYDIAANAVKVIEEYKEAYYFIQITDAHLPGHTFWGDYGYETDNSEMNDFEEVVEDINLLNPEFVLLTGDLLNEGEMEDFECLRHHTKVMEMLETFEVPVYIVPGNHDLGGWDDTPPAQGTARKEWWRFFGWRQPHGFPMQEEYYVHDYSFDYGDVHFTGLESSDNYDHYMYNVYGEQGFIASQLKWLDEDLLAAGDKTKVLFYHYDFNGDLNLSDLGADMALWGHTHRNTDDYTHPYNIGTDNICDGTEAYRVIRVDNGNLTPEPTLYANSSNQNVKIEYSAENNGLADSLVAVITNNHDQAFANTLVKFVMPTSDLGYVVTNGTLQQVIPSADANICYVQVSLAANSNVSVSVSVSTELLNSSIELFADVGLNPVYPNPFDTQAQITYRLNAQDHVNITVYNAQGKPVKVLANEIKPAGEHIIFWDGTNDLDNKVTHGIYFCRYEINGNLVGTQKLMYVE